MVKPSRPTSSRDKVRAHRARLREQGLRPVQVRAPDIRLPAFKAAAGRQARLVALDPHGPHEAETTAFIDAITDCGDDGR